MKYTEEKRGWRTLARVRVILPEDWDVPIRKYIDFKGDEKVASGQKMGVRVQVFNPSAVEAGKEVDLLFEKGTGKNEEEGRFRVSIIPDNVCGIRLTNPQSFIYEFLELTRACEEAQAEIAGAWEI